MASLFDDPRIDEELFFPREDEGDGPEGARDVAIDVGGASLHARVHAGPARPLAAIVLFHGNGEIVADWDDFAPRFADAGARLAVVDFRGYGRSTGTPTLRALVEDARPALEAIARELEGADGAPLPVIVMGRSLGSACAAEIARSLPRLASGFVYESGFADLVAFARRRGVRVDVVEEGDLQALCPLRKLAANRAPLLVLHGADDRLIHPSEGRAAHEASASRDKRLVIVPDAGHNDVGQEEVYWREVGGFVDRVARAADRRAGSLVAQALGDALGFLVEGHAPAICALFAREAFTRDAPPDRVRGPFRFGQYSDDTQLARELALAMIEAPAWQPERFATRVARIFEEDAIVGRGRATESAARRLAAGVAWREAGEPAPSAGNGAAMRAGPVGLASLDDDERLRVADEQALVTHADPRARAAAILVADVVADACARNAGALAEVGTPPWCARLAARVRAMDPVLASGLEALPGWLALPEEEVAARVTAHASPPRGAAHAFEAWHGISPFATPSALYAVFAYARSPGDAPRVLERAVAVGGDVDTVAAMAGAMVGAAVGLAGLGPRLARWARSLEDQGAYGFAELVRIAHALA
jgi:ADP-ribosylglycohydrolase/alpha-beta hydrolase superfamily lysophospholipase